MTIRVTVKNEDSREDRLISAQQRALSGDELGGCPARYLKGGESAEFFVHDSNQIVVKENFGKAKVISVNSKKVEVAESRLSGSQIKAKAGVDVHQCIWMTVPGQADENIPDSEIIDIIDGQQFTTSPNGGFA